MNKRTIKVDVKRLVDRVREKYGNLCYVDLYKKINVLDNDTSFYLHTSYFIEAKLFFDIVEQEISNLSFISNGHYLVLDNNNLKRIFDKFSSIIIDNDEYYLSKNTMNENTGFLKYSVEEYAKTKKIKNKLRINSSNVDLNTLNKIEEELVFESYNIGEERNRKIKRFLLQTKNKLLNDENLTEEEKLILNSLHIKGINKDDEIVLSYQSLA